ncbi:GNAT family N-acetyltransferase [Leptolyngbya boryana CZ1]|uniref:GNAT family N-acetyltransferase n=1 Tax=Leptolyngbya boryana CZ1 TaxID=3060204 RepID=A0AA96WND5_LEPBY|nr:MULTISPECIES: GNAT family N-acetyltransferase [Leptolyngbya]MBN8564472.1 GNAT family N-acetyltransferase [Leptolyngbya sp. UWPOB_LEPTO1]WNZ43260.1 GNAT family N-acetyltransferase [Leptolyngbya boryana CZ1]
MEAEIKIATIADLEILLPLVQEFHAVADLHLADYQRENSVKMLLTHAELGGIWLICCRSQVVGYIALCTSYSIEFGGKDAFIDEFYIKPLFQGKGLGKQTLEQIKTIAKALGIYAIHLEVLKSNLSAQKLYNQSKFENREQYVLMSVSL